MNDNNDVSMVCPEKRIDVNEELLKPLSPILKFLALPIIIRRQTKMWKTKKVRGTIAWDLCTLANVCPQSKNLPSLWRIPSAFLFRWLTILLYRPWCLAAPSKKERSQETSLTTRRYIFFVCLFCFFVDFFVKLALQNACWGNREWEIKNCLKKRSRFRINWEVYQIAKEIVMFNSKAVFLSDLKALPNVHLL